MSIAGVSFLIGVPVALSANKKDSSANIIPSSIDHGGGRSISFEVGECTLPKSGSEIFFGSQMEGKVCGTVEDHREKVKGSEEYTSLFKDHWNNSSQDWKGEEQQSKCVDGDEQGVTSGEETGEGTQYLGQCGTIKVDETKFVKRAQGTRLIENNEEGNFWICSSNCGAPDAESILGSPRILKEKKGDNSGKKVKFYKN